MHLNIGQNRTTTDQPKGSIVHRNTFFQAILSGIWTLATYGLLYLVKFGYCEPVLFECFNIASVPNCEIVSKLQLKDRDKIESYKRTWNGDNSSHGMTPSIAYELNVAILWPKLVRYLVGLVVGCWSRVETQHPDSGGHTAPNIPPAVSYSDDCFQPLTKLKRHISGGNSKKWVQNSTTLYEFKPA
jgi:hypothetical protein